MGATVFGDVAYERLALNESTLWSGGKEDADALHSQSGGRSRLMYGGKEIEVKVSPGQKQALKF